MRLIGHPNSDNGEAGFFSKQAAPFSPGLVRRFPLFAPLWTFPKVFFQTGTGAPIPTFANYAATSDANVGIKGALATY
jgi:hypothetical protein